MFENLSFRDEKDNSDESVEVSKLEFSPEFEEMTSSQIKEKLEEVNNSLLDQKIQWRLPTKKELEEGGHDLNYWTINNYIGDNIAGPLKDKVKLKLIFVKEL